MPTLISYGNELIRINSEKNRIEYSTNRGSSWSSRCTSTSYGTFLCLLPYGNEILACTSKGVYYSTNRGSSWSSRCTSTSYGTFMELNEMDGKLFATTSKGLYYSTNKGSSWSKK